MTTEKNVIGLVPKKEQSKEVSQPLVEWLEALLEEAKTGELRGMVGACQFEDDATYFVMGWAGGFQALGALRMASYVQAGFMPGEYVD